MVSTVAFKYSDLCPASASTTPDALTFLTSGTTVGRDRRGRHVVARPEVYRASALAHLKSMMFPDGARMRMLAIHPTADRMPESSLSTMISWCIDAFGKQPSLCAAERSGLDVQAALEFLEGAERDADPVCILGTTAASAAIFERLRMRGRAIRLPSGSRMMDTGGAKGQIVPLTSHQVVDLAGTLLAIHPDYVINEYGMTELCSQLYDATRLNSPVGDGVEDRVKLAPAWMLPAALDPETLRRLPDGTTGMLAFIDLANVGSVSAVLTEDFGIVEGNRVRVLGRAIAGGPRGCALSIAEFAGKTNSAPAPSALRAEPSDDCRVTPADIENCALQIRSALAKRIEPRRIARALAAVFDRWRDRSFGVRRRTIGLIAEQTRFSARLLEESLDALLQPFNPAALLEAADTVVPSEDLIGFVMAGNVAGSGMHEVALGLIAGTGLIVKTASREPHMFEAFANTLADEDPALGQRIAVFSWSRDRIELTSALRRCVDATVVYGDDSTVSSFGGDAGVIGFGGKLSAALVTRDAVRTDGASKAAALLARDATLFEQLGCLSPHHVFVECDDGGAERFAQDFAHAMRDLAEALPPPIRLELEDSAALRGFREAARWRSIGGEGVILTEGPGLSWAVAFDRDAPLTASPGLRCVYVTPVRDLDDLRERLVSARGRIEAFAVAGAEEAPTPALREILDEAGVSYLAQPGAMQSPPLTWRHGRGEFLRRVTSRR